MINLIKNNRQSTRTNLFNACKASEIAKKATSNGMEVYIIIDGENVANVFENGNVIFTGFKNLSEVINTVNK
ncbi:hypothetical protein [Chryseobacterium vrystaatense]|uniref:Uncharacterized protein n=1 Tax=Chryseobacterium vrystaatense TaxID=307480 RepID=A0A1M4ZJ79_9FLAO|nr:hypothetical protein [Chryseobacterium vrystaatense]SHF17862.1 hypothetical protein SAMN02787073_1608 [Chryseobacterium vrystaatense]